MFEKLSRIPPLVWIILLIFIISLAFSTPAIALAITTLLIANFILGILQGSAFLTAFIFCCIAGITFAPIGDPAITWIMTISAGVLIALALRPGRIGLSIIRRITPDAGQTATPRQLAMLDLTIRIARIARLASAFLALALMKTARGTLRSLTITKPAESPAESTEPSPLTGDPLSVPANDEAPQNHTPGGIGSTEEIDRIDRHNMESAINAITHLISAHEQNVALHYLSVKRTKADVRELYGTPADIA